MTNFPSGSEYLSAPVHSLMYLIVVPSASKLPVSMYKSILSLPVARPIAVFYATIKSSNVSFYSGIHFSPVKVTIIIRVN
jgi:hypothetical protein